MTQTLNRRSFLKLSSAAAAVVGLSTIPGTLGALEESQKQLKGNAKYTPVFVKCVPVRVPLKQKVEDGKGVFIKGNPADKSRGGKVCARGSAGFNQLYDPQRLVKPIMRVGERGEEGGKWSVGTKLTLLSPQNWMKSNKNMVHIPWHLPHEVVGRKHGFII